MNEVKEVTAWGVTTAGNGVRGPGNDSQYTADGEWRQTHSRKLPVASDIPPLPDAVKSSLPLWLSGRDRNYFAEAGYQHTLCA